MYYTMHVAGLERRLPICPVSDSLSIGAFVIFGDAELTVSAARDLLRLAPEHDYILTAEAKGIPLAHEMARQNHEETYFVARKAPKLYMPDALCVTVQSITTAREQKLYLDRADAERMRGKRILIVDDVISTGESLRAVEQLVEAAGGSVCGRMAILAEGDAQKRSDLLYLYTPPPSHPHGPVIEYLTGCRWSAAAPCRFSGSWSSRKSRCFRPCARSCSGSGSDSDFCSGYGFPCLCLRFFICGRLSARLVCAADAKLCRGTFL